MSHPDRCTTDPQVVVVRPDVSVDEAAEFGRLESEFAVEYPAFGVSAVEDAFGAFNADDLDGFLARFAEEKAIFGVGWSDAPEVFGALMAAGQSYELELCEPAGISDQTLKIDCAITVFPALGKSGVVVAGAISAHVGANGTIGRLSNTIDWALAVEFRTDFERWLADTYPDVRGQVRLLQGGLIPSAEDAELVASYYEEFIAQSDDYPVVD